MAHKWRTSGNRTGNGRVSYGYQHPAYKHAMTHLSSGGPSITALAASRLV